MCLPYTITCLATLFVLLSLAFPPTVGLLAPHSNLLDTCSISSPSFISELIDTLSQDYFPNFIDRFYDEETVNVMTLGRTDEFYALLPPQPFLPPISLPYLVEFYALQHFPSLSRRARNIIRSSFTGEHLSLFLTPQFCLDIYRDNVHDGTQSSPYYNVSSSELIQLLLHRHNSHPQQLQPFDPTKKSYFEFTPPHQSNSTKVRVVFYYIHKLRQLPKDPLIFLTLLIILINSIVFVRVSTAANHAAASCLAGSTLLRTYTPTVAPHKMIMRSNENFNHNNHKNIDDYVNIHQTSHNTNENDQNLDLINENTFNDHSDTNDSDDDHPDSLHNHQKNPENTDNDVQITIYNGKLYTVRTLPKTTYGIACARSLIQMTFSLIYQPDAHLSGNSLPYKQLQKLKYQQFINSTQNMNSTQNEGITSYNTNNTSRGGDNTLNTDSNKIIPLKHNKNPQKTNQNHANDIISSQTCVSPIPLSLSIDRSAVLPHLCSHTGASSPITNHTTQFLPTIPTPPKITPYLNRLLPINAIFQDNDNIYIFYPMSPQEQTSYRHYSDTILSTDDPLSFPTTPHYRPHDSPSSQTDPNITTKAAIEGLYHTRHSLTLNPSFAQKIIPPGLFQPLFSLALGDIVLTHQNDLFYHLYLELIQNKNAFLTKKLSLSFLSTSNLRPLAIYNTRRQYITTPIPNNNIIRASRKTPITPAPKPIIKSSYTYQLHNRNYYYFDKTKSFASFIPQPTLTQRSIKKLSTIKDKLVEISMGSFIIAYNLFRHLKEVLSTDSHQIYRNGSQNNRHLFNNNNGNRDINSFKKKPRPLRSAKYGLFNLPMTILDLIKVFDLTTRPYLVLVPSHTNEITPQMTPPQIPIFDPAVTKYKQQVRNHRHETVSYDLEAGQIGLLQHRHDILHPSSQKGDLRVKSQNNNDMINNYNDDNETVHPTESCSPRLTPSSITATILPPSPYLPLSSSLWLHNLHTLNTIFLYYLFPHTYHFNPSFHHSLLRVVPITRTDQRHHLHAQYRLLQQQTQYSSQNKGNHSSTPLYPTQTSNGLFFKIPSLLSLTYDMAFGVHQLHSNSTLHGNLSPSSILLLNNHRQYPTLTTLAAATHTTILPGSRALLQTITPHITPSHRPSIPLFAQTAVKMAPIPCASEPPMGSTGPFSFNATALVWHPPEIQIAMCTELSRVAAAQITSYDESPSLIQPNTPILSSNALMKTDLKQTDEHSYKNNEFNPDCQFVDNNGNTPYCDNNNNTQNLHNRSRSMSYNSSRFVFPTTFHSPFAHLSEVLPHVTQRPNTIISPTPQVLPTFAADSYSLGLMVYYLMTLGHSPFILKPISSQSSQHYLHEDVVTNNIHSHDNGNVVRTQYTTKLHGNHKDNTNAKTRTNTTDHQTVANIRMYSFDTLHVIYKNSLHLFSKLFLIHIHAMQDILIHTFSFNRGMSIVTSTTPTTPQSLLHALHYPPHRLYTIHNFITLLTQPNPALRLSTLSTLSHPIFWPAQKQLHFLIELNEFLSKDSLLSYSPVLTKLLILLETTFIGYNHSYNWLFTTESPVILQLLKRRSYNSNSILHTLRFMRNLYVHRHELNINIVQQSQHQQYNQNNHKTALLQTKMIDNELFSQYILSLAPTTFIQAWLAASSLLQIVHDECMLQQNGYHHHKSRQPQVGDETKQNTVKKEDFIHITTNNNTYSHKTTKNHHRDHIILESHQPNFIRCLSTFISKYYIGFSIHQLNIFRNQYFRI